MAKTLDDHIADAVAKATETAIKKAMPGIMKGIENVIARHFQEAMGKLVAEKLEDERMLTISEASRKLMVNPAKVRSLAKAGEISIIDPPGGRAKVVASSVNAYIRRLQGAAG